MGRKAALNTDYGHDYDRTLRHKMPQSCARFIELARRAFQQGDALAPGRRLGDPDRRGDLRVQADQARDRPVLEAQEGRRGPCADQRPHSATTQFYIVKRDSLFLDGNYAMFGMTVDGQPILDRSSHDRLVS